MFKPDLELRRAVFEKMGFQQIGVLWLPPKSFHIQWQGTKSLPPIETDWHVTAQYLVPWMWERGYLPYFGPKPYMTQLEFCWLKIHEENHREYGIEIQHEPVAQIDIIDSNIPRAAVEAAINYLEERGKG